MKTMIDEVKYNINKALNYNPDMLRLSVFNECCDDFRLNEKERDEIVLRLKNGEYAK